MKLHHFNFSGHCHRVRLLCGLLGIDLELVPVDMANKAHKSTDYMQLNPFGQVPVLQDGGVVLRDSNAILLYLAENYDRKRRFLPEDPVARAHVYEWLATAAGPLYLGPARARAIKKWARAGDHAEALRQSDALLAVMDAHLATHRWLVGDGPTLADVACYSYIAVADEGGVNLDAFPNVRNWLEAAEALEGFVPMPKQPGE